MPAVDTSGAVKIPGVRKSEEIKTETTTSGTLGITSVIPGMPEIDMEGVKKDALPLLLCAVLIFFVIKG